MQRGGVFSSNIFAGNRKGFYGLGQDTPPPTPDTSPAPPPPAPPNVALMVGWGAVLLTAVGIFYGVTRQGSPRRVAANRRRRRSSRRRSSRRRRSRRPRRNSRRRSSRRRSTRRNKRRKAFQGWAREQQRSRRYKALSAAARKRMPDSSFALSGRRFPIKGPPGSSRERDKWQAMQAIRYLNMGRVKNRSDYLKVRNAIIREYGPNFWRRYDGPTWPKIQKAKRKRAATRRGRRRTSRRKVAANARRPRHWNKVIYWGRHGNAYYVQAPAGKVRLYRGAGAKNEARMVAQGVARSYGMRIRKDDGRMRRTYERRFGKKR